MSIGNISLFDVYFSTLPYSLCVCACVYRVCVCDCKYMCVCVCACVWDREREGWMDGRTDEKESHCVGCHCFCAVCVDCTTAPTLHTHRPSSQCSVDCMTAILSSPPPLPAHTPTYHTQTSLSLPELCWLHDCLACVCAAFSCVDVPEAPWLGVPRTAPSISGNPCTDTEPSGLCVCAAPSCVDVPEAPWLGVPRTAPSISGNPCTDSALQTLSSTAAPGPMTGLSIWTALTVGQTLECQALGQLLQNPQPRRNSRQNGYGDSGRFLIVVGWVVAVWYDVLSATYLWFGCLVALLWLG